MRTDWLNTWAEITYWVENSTCKKNCFKIQDTVQACVTHGRITNPYQHGVRWHSGFRLLSKHTLTGTDTWLLHNHTCQSGRQRSTLNNKTQTAVSSHDQLSIAALSDVLLECSHLLKDGTYCYKYEMEKKKKKICMWSVWNKKVSRFVLCCILDEFQVRLHAFELN